MVSKPYDFKNKPLLPFGYRVMSHNAVDNQTKLSPNGTLHYYVGPAPYTKQGILLYNPTKELQSICRSFQQLNRNEPTIPALPLQVADNESTPSSQVSNTHSSQDTIPLPTKKILTLKYKIWQRFSGNMTT